MKNLPVLTREIINQIKNNIYYWDLVLKTCQGSSETVYLVFEINMANVEVATVAYCISMYMYTIRPWPNFLLSESYPQFHINCIWLPISWIWLKVQNNMQVWKIDTYFMLKLCLHAQRFWHTFISDNFYDFWRYKQIKQWKTIVIFFKESEFFMNKNNFGYDFCLFILIYWFKCLLALLNKCSNSFTC